MELTSVHRSQILRDFYAMQAEAAEFSGYAEKFRCFLARNGVAHYLHGNLIDDRPEPH